MQNSSILIHVHPFSSIIPPFVTHFQGRMGKFQNDTTLHRRIFQPTARWASSEGPWRAGRISLVASGPRWNDPSIHQSINPSTSHLIFLIKNFGDEIQMNWGFCDCATICGHQRSRVCLMKFTFLWRKNADSKGRKSDNSDHSSMITQGTVAAKKALTATMQGVVFSDLQKGSDLEYSWDFKVRKNSQIWWHVL